MDFDRSSQTLDYFDFTGNWWHDGWGYMYIQSGEDQKLSFEFEGAGAAIYALMDNNSSDFDVYIDEAYVETVNLNGSGKIARVFSKDGLTPAHHTLELRVKPGTGDYVNISAYEYDYVESKAPTQPVADIITLVSPAYRADIEGETTLDFIFLGGYAEAEAYSLVAAADVVSLGDPVALDEDGAGSIIFDAEILPHGPVSVRVIARKTDGTVSRDNFLQFYNLGGTVVNTGLGDLPPQLDGMSMELLFADDFTAMPTISRDGLDRNGNPTTYIAHKPDYKDYGAAQFADYEGPNNPFHQMDEYLRITTAYDENLVDGYNRKHYTGFLASVNRQGEGIKTDGYVNQYFEARFFTGANPSLWPAFWTLSNKVNIGSDNEPCDEIDIIEGYMAWPDGYSLTAHAWGPGHPQSGPHDRGRRVPTEELYGQKGNIAMGFHTYGVLITEDITYYYFDDELVNQHETLYYSWTMGNYFMINSAMSDHSFPEGYGFERYGNESHMYIDWVRVYQQPADPNAVRFTTLPIVHDVQPGDTLDVDIIRSAGAQELSGFYDMDLPDGWTLVSGGDFAAGSATDTLTFQVNRDYVLYDTAFSITPVADERRYDAITIRARTDTPFSLDIYPVLNQAGDGWEVAVKLINGYEAAGLPGGYIEVISPASVAGRYPFSSIPANGSVVSHIPGTPLTLLELTEYTFKVVREDGYERTYERDLSNLTAVRADTPIVIDGIIDEHEWAGAMEIILGEEAATNYNAGRPWGGEDDSSAVGRVKWDEEYLYISVGVKDDIHFQENNVMNSWGSDSLQFSIDQGRASGYGGPHTRFIAAVNSADGSYGLAVEDKGVLNSNPSTDLCVNVRDEVAKTTNYEVALKWSEILPPDQYPPQAGITDIGFAFLVNDNDGDAHGRVGWLSYMGGIGYGKHPDEFGDLILTDRTELAEPDEPGEPEESAVIEIEDGVYGAIFEDANITVIVEDLEEELEDAFIKIRRFSERNTTEGFTESGIFLDITCSKNLKSHWLRIEIGYDPAEIGGTVNEDDLMVYQFNESSGKWKDTPKQGVDTEKKIVWTRLKLKEFNTLGIFAGRD